MTKLSFKEMSLLPNGNSQGAQKTTAQSIKNASPEKETIFISFRKALWYVLMNNI